VLTFTYYVIDINVGSFIILIRMIQSNSSSITQNKKRCRLTNDPEEKVRILLELGQGLIHSNKNQAKKYATKAFNLAKERNNQKTIVHASNLLTKILRLTGKIDQALKYSLVGLEFSRRMKDKRAEANSLNSLGAIYWHKGEFDKAIEIFKQSLSLCDKIKDEHAQARAYTNLGLLYWEKGNINMAMEFQKRGLEIQERLRDSFGIGISQINLGLIYGDMGDWDKAIECYYRALVEMEKLGNKTDSALCYSNLAEIYLRRGKLEKAKELFEQAIKNADLEPAPWVRAEALGNLGEAYFRSGDSLRAIDCYNQDIRLCHRTDDKEELAETYRRIGELLLHSGEVEQASKTLHQGLELVRLTGAKREEGNILRVMGSVYSKLNNPAEAKVSFQKGLRILIDFGNSYELGKIYLDYGKVLNDYGEREIALTYWYEAKEIFRRLGAAYELEIIESCLSKIGIQKDQASSFMKNLTNIINWSFSLAEFGQQVLKFLKDSLAFENGVLIINPNITTTIGNFSSEEIEKISRKRELQITPFDITCPLCIGRNRTGVLYLTWKESKPQPFTQPELGSKIGVRFDRTLFETIGNILALGIERIACHEETKPIKKSPRISFSPQMLVGAETSLKEIFATIQKAAPTKVCVLIRGESGTGKELIARTVHNLSDRSGGPFIPINCAAIPETLLESELFGIEKGTATGVSERKGKFELAHTGTVFLDEIGDMSLALQAKILRLLQEKQLERVGGRKPINVNIRIIAATNKDLEKAIAEGNFRDDLYYRLNVVSIRLPALRERKEDVPKLVGHFIGKYCREYQRKPLSVSEEAMARLINYSWPGNIRELENVIEQAVVLARGDQITLADLPSIFHQTGEKIFEYQQAKIQAKTEFQTLEKEFLIQALNQSNWNISKAAIVLNIARRHLYRLMKKYQIA